MRAATRIFAGAAATVLALGGLGPAAANAAREPSPATETCRYVVQADKAVPVRSGPGKKHEERGRLEPSDDPHKATCAARGRGPEHWVRLKSGEFEDLWVWRNRLQPWSG
ncbi:hypothetical protein ETD86_52145 [Nonomuraea turkmeniaca]|uniref:SH3 domain-containing protein n=1 Tax=Nonomuraea turkmeniaca TaxID=103838 RepID=A0A5S4EVA0_9ACTN|nr:hypothetical protein [Nonomuraea turkmeniaca]TMR07027.1 hypothetical protein ETD86_52145 [Nonomuraea turkmeniaca]